MISADKIMLEIAVEHSIKKIKLIQKKVTIEVPFFEQGQKKIKFTEIMAYERDDLYLVVNEVTKCLEQQQLYLIEYP